MFDPITGGLLGLGVLGAGAAYMGSKEQADAAQAAAGMQSQYGQQSIDFQREMFNKLLELQQPYYNIGTSAINPYLQAIGLPTQPMQPQAGQGQNALSGILADYNKYKTSLTPSGVAPNSLNAYLAPIDGVYDAYYGGGYGGIYAEDMRPQGGLPPVPSPQPLSFEDWYKANQTVNQLPGGFDPNTDLGGGAPGGMVLDLENIQGIRPDDQAGQGMIRNVNTTTPEATGFESSPLYQWQLEEGTNAIANALRARGKYDSTAGLRSISDFTRALGAEETEKYYNRLLDAINIGRGAAASSGQGAMQTGANIGSTYTNLGNMLASSKIYGGEANAGFWSGLGGMPMNLASIYYLTR